MKPLLENCSSPGTGKQLAGWVTQQYVHCLLSPFLGLLGCNVGPKYIRPASSGSIRLQESGAPSKRLMAPSGSPLNRKMRRSVGNGGRSIRNLN